MTTNTELERMQCLEVWGGNTPVDRGFTTPGLQVWTYSQPLDGATHGGDVYYVSSCASGRITRLLLADVAGHGADVAELSSCLRDLMRRNVNLVRQERFVQAMNRQFAERAADDEFATAIVCTFFSPDRSLQFCSAGHPPALLYRRASETWTFAGAEAETQPAPGIADTPLGAIDEATYSRHTLKLDEGDLCLCMSDAFTEARSSDGSLLGPAGVRALVEQLDVGEPDKLIPALLERLCWENADNLKQDDATLLLFRADGSSPSLASDLLTPVRLLRGVRDAARA